jgi:hypothetical protein
MIIGALLSVLCMYTIYYIEGSGYNMGGDKNLALFFFFILVPINNALGMIIYERIRKPKRKLRIFGLALSMVITFVSCFIGIGLLGIANYIVAIFLLLLWEVSFTILCYEFVVALYDRNKTNTRPNQALKPTE